MIAPTPFEQFETILISVFARMLERREADAALFRLMATHAEARLLLEKGVETAVEPVLSLLNSHAKIQHRGFTQLDAEYSRDTIIVAITLFDSFLTDLTRFLLLNRPTALPKDRQVKLGDILNAGSYELVVTNAVDRYTHELAYKPLKERLEVLADKFGFELASIDVLLDELQAFAITRNELVHTISRFHYSAGGTSGVVSVETRGPKSISPDHAARALDVSLEVVGALAEIIGFKLFGRTPQLASMIRRVSVKKATDGN